MRALTGSLLATSDGRERVAVPFWNGVLSAVGATLFGFGVSFAATILLVFAAVLATGLMPSTNPGHPLIASSEFVFYAAAGWVAWRRIRRIGLRPFRALTAHDVRTIGIGLLALIAVRVVTVVQLIATNQTKHVQTGFEHFDVVTKTPAVTALGVAIALLSIVVLGPLVEEMVFRGLLFGALAPRLGVIASALVTALAFGAVHADPVLFPSLAALGFVAALAYAATGNLWTAVALHALNNALGAAVLVTMSLHHAVR